MVRRVIQTKVGGQGSWVFAADTMNLLVLLFGELTQLNSLAPKTRNSAPRVMLTCWQTKYQRD